MSDCIKKWLVISGGPGLSNNYLKEHLSKIDAEKFIFIDLFGSPESDTKKPSLNDIYLQIQQAYEKEDNSSCGILTHSFGNFLILEMINNNMISPLCLLMLNPIPLKFEKWQASLSKISSKVTEEDLKKINDLSSNGLFTELFSVLVKYYTHNSNVLDFVIPFDGTACDFVSNQVYEFDHSKVLNEIKFPVIRIEGESDSFYTDKKLLSKSTYVINNVGHFPFIENYDAFLEVFKKSENNLCREIKLKRKD